MSHVLVELAFVALKEIDRSQQAERFHGPRIHSKSFGNILLSLVVLFRIDILLGREQVSFDGVRVHRQRVLKLRARSFRVGHGEISSHTEVRFRQVGIDFQRILVACEGFGLIVFFRKQVAPDHKRFGIAGIALGRQLEDIVRIMKVAGCPHRAGNVHETVWRARALEIRDQLVVNRLCVVTFARIFQNFRFFELCGDRNIWGVLNGI